MYDAIVIGARCAGASTAMLLARKGYDVLLVDRATFPSEIPHGHFIHRHGPRRLASWGLLEPMLATNCPAVSVETMDLADFPLTGTDLSIDGVPAGLGPRRANLDAVLVEAAVHAGAELREGFAVHDYLGDGDRIMGVRGRDVAGGGSLVTERAAIVIGADGRNSPLARAVDAPLTEDFPTVSCWYFSYWSGVPWTGLEVYVRDERAIFAFPTNDELFAVMIAFPIGQLPSIKRDIEAAFMGVLDIAPDLAERVRGGRREERFYGATQLPNFVRKPHGPGWALVGDAGVHKDPFLALGVCDALRDAELLADALHEGLSGRAPMEEALAGYERARNEATLPDFHLNFLLAHLQPLPPEVSAQRAALRDDPEGARRWYLEREGLVRAEVA
jgi:flavin-dependent dehydrogenase